MTIRETLPADLPTLTDLGIRSKASWGYTEEQMTVFREELTWTDELLRDRIAYTAVVGDSPGGYYSLRPIDAWVVDLEHLFVDPDRFGGGIGRSLFEHAASVARDHGFRTMTITTDPNASGFYERLGGRKVEEIPSSIPGRQIPVYHFDLPGSP